jgi:hypothetical protein
MPTLSGVDIDKGSDEADKRMEQPGSLDPPVSALSFGIISGNLQKYVCNQPNGIVPPFIP